MLHHRADVEVPLRRVLLGGEARDGAERDGLTGLHADAETEAGDAPRRHPDVDVHGTVARRHLGRARIAHRPRLTAGRHVHVRCLHRRLGLGAGARRGGHRPVLGLRLPPRRDLDAAERTDRVERALRLLEPDEAEALSRLQAGHGEHRLRRQIAVARHADAADHAGGGSGDAEDEEDLVTRGVDLDLARDVRVGVARVGEHAEHPPLGLLVERLVEAIAPLELEHISELRAHAFRELVDPAQRHPSDGRGLALVDGEGDVDGAVAALPVAARALAAFAPGGGGWLDVGRGHPRVVEAAGAIPALDALRVTLEHALVEERPLLPGPAPEAHHQVRSVEGRLAAGRRAAEAEVDAEARSLARAEAGGDRLRVDLLHALEANPFHAVARGRNGRAAGARQQRDHARRDEPLLPAPHHRRMVPAPPRDLQPTSWGKARRSSSFAGGRAPIIGSSRDFARAGGAPRTHPPGGDAPATATQPAKRPTGTNEASARADPQKNGALPRASRLPATRRSRRAQPSTFAGVRTLSTGQGAWRTTRSATLPMSRCARPVRPCVERTIMSTSSFPA